MKRLIRVLIAISLLIIVFSCKKDKNSDMETLTKETISAKWMVSGTNGPYKSFEFNKSGNYIVVLNSGKSTNSQVVIFGTYQILDNQKIALSDFGTITVSSINTNIISFALSLQASPGNEMAISATKAAELSNSAKMDLFCRTWKVVTVNGVNVKGTKEESTILFSGAGTYLVVWYDGESGLAQWKWKDNTETILCYSWDGEPTCNGKDEVKILELSQSSVKVVEEFGGETYVYVLVPTTGTKSAMLKSNCLKIEKPKKKGLIKNQM